MKRAKLSTVVCIALCFLAGCGSNGQNEITEKICFGGIKKSQAMEVGQEILGRLHFAVAKVDADSGYIRSRPLAGAQFFEFWRKDNVGRFNSAEANLHSIRRTVELNVTELEAKVCIDCDVNVQRLSLSDPGISERSVGRNSLSQTRAGTAKMGLNYKNKTWIDLENDKKLASLILKQIENRLEKK